VLEGFFDPDFPKAHTFQLHNLVALETFIGSGAADILMLRKIHEALRELAELAAHRPMIAQQRDVFGKLESLHAVATFALDSAVELTLVRFSINLPNNLRTFGAKHVVS
jgi:hypothetical protein